MSRTSGRGVILSIMLKKNLLLFFLLLLICLNSIHASHIRGGYIRVERLSTTNLSFEFTFIGYRDTDTGIAFGSGDFDFGDGTVISENFSVLETQISENIVRAEFSLSHTYQTPNRYIVSYSENNRNGGITNMENSLNTPFYVETEISTPHTNSSPSLSLPSFVGYVEYAYVSKLFASDKENNQLLFSEAIPQQGRGNFVANYVLPNSSNFYQDARFGNQYKSDSAIFFIDSKSGNIIWDAPGDILNLSGLECPEGYQQCSEYSIALNIYEYDSYSNIFLSRTLVDYQIQIVPQYYESNYPKIKIKNEEHCINEDDFFEFSIDFDQNFYFKISPIGGVNTINGSYFSDSVYRVNGESDFYMTSTLLDNSIISIDLYDELDNNITSFGFVSSENCYERILMTSNERFKKQQIAMIYPNPTDGIINIKMAEFKEATLYNLSGKRIMRSTDNRIDVSALSEGVYIIKLENRSGDRFSTRLIKE